MRRTLAGDRRHGFRGAAPVVVARRGAARSECPLIAEEIEDKDERNAFVRKAISASGKE